MLSPANGVYAPGFENFNKKSKLAVHNNLMPRI